VLYAANRENLSTFIHALARQLNAPYSADQPRIPKPPATARLS